MQRRDRQLGLLYAAPLSLFLGLAFLAPILLVAGFSTMPAKVFDLAHVPDFSAYGEFLRQGYWKSVAWSLGMALVATLILFVVCWPLAYGMAKVFKRFTLVLTIGVVMTLFVSENIRLFGWVLTLMKGGLIEGHLRAWTGVGFDSPLYGVPIIISGLVYVYLPFMLFPLAQGIAMVPDDARQGRRRSRSHAVADLHPDRPASGSPRHRRRVSAELRSRRGCRGRSQDPWRSGRHHHCR